MSYNIDTCKIKKLNDLVIPLKAFYTSPEIDWHPSKPEIINAETNEVSIEMGCGQEIHGIWKDGNIHVTKLDISGEGSGTNMRYILEPALKESTGELEATLIWEGGDSITRLTVINGVFKQESIEL